MSRINITDDGGVSQETCDIPTWPNGLACGAYIDPDTQRCAKGHEARA